MQRPRKIEDMKKICTGTREVFGRGVGDSVWANESGKKIETLLGKRFGHYTPIESASI